MKELIVQFFIGLFIGTALAVPIVYVLSNIR